MWVMAVVLFMMWWSFWLVVYNNEEVQLFYYCIFRKRMRNLYSMKKYWCKLRFLGSDCQDLQRHQPLCRSSSRWLCCTRVVLKISAIVSFLHFCGIDDDDDFSHRSERRPILSRRTYQVPSSTQTTGDSLWRNSNLRMEVLKKADPCNWDHF